MKRRPLAGQFLWVVIGRVLAALLQAVTFILLARELAPADFGLFSALFGIATLAQTSFDLGLSTLILRERAKSPVSGVVTAALRLNNRLSALLAVATVLVVAGGALLVDEMFWQLLPLAVWVASERNADVWLGVALADGDAKVTTANLVLRRTAALGLFVGLGVIGLPPLLAFSVGVAVAAVASSAFAHAFVNRRLPPASAVTARELVRDGWPYWVNSVATQARNLDVVIVAVAGGAAQAGFYAAASRITGPLRILPTSLASVLLPQAARTTSTTLRPLVKLVAACVAVLAVVYALVAWTTPWFVPVLLGDNYVGAVPAIQIAALGLVFAATASLLGSLLQGVGLKHFVAQSSVAMTVACLLGAAVGAAAGGAIGASLALVAAFVIQAALLLVRLALFMIRKEPNR